MSTHFSITFPRTALDVPEIEEYCMWRNCLFEPRQELICFEVGNELKDFCSFLGKYNIPYDWTESVRRIVVHEAKPLPDGGYAFSKHADFVNKSDVSEILSDSVLSDSEKIVAVEKLIASGPRQFREIKPLN